MTDQHAPRDVRMHGFSQRAEVGTVLKWIDQHAKPLGSTVVPLEESVGRVSAEPLTASIDVPAFDRSRRIKTTSAETFVAEAGPPDGLPIVFLHGNPDSHHVWSAVVERLKATHRCIAPDMPGYGASGEMQDVTLEGQAVFVRELLHSLTALDLSIQESYRPPPG